MTDHHGDDPKGTCQPDAGVPSTVHPLVGFTTALEELLDKAATVSAWSMTPREQAQVLPRLTGRRVGWPEWS